MLPTQQLAPSSTKQSPLISAASRLWKHCTEEVHDPMAERRADALLVAASVIATMNFQAGINPPGGSYQETKYLNGASEYNAGQARTNSAEIAYEAGQAIAAYVASEEYRCFTTANTISFAFSMTTMFLLVSGVSMKRRIFSFLLTLTMFATITATAYSYKYGMEATTPDGDEKRQGWKFVNHLVNGGLILWYVVAGVIVAVFVGKRLMKQPLLTSANRRLVNLEKPNNTRVIYM